VCWEQCTELKNIPGERVAFLEKWDNIEQYLVFLKHSALYALAVSLSFQEKGQFVLDLGCGTGYGVNTLSTAYKKVVGVDLSEYAVSHARKINEKLDVMFSQARGESLPFKCETFDAVISIEVIEHVTKVNCFLDEIRRVLKKGGVFILSTPNREVRLLPLQRPWNPFHVREFNAIQFRETLANHFSTVKIKGLVSKREIAQIELRGYAKLRSPLQAYCFQPLKHAIRTTVGWNIYTRMRTLLRRLRKPSRGANFTTEQFSLEDFWLAEQGVRGCTNLVAICRTSSR
jgi:ubiquinone/menaquinone biosynthesis C-methylase UbiE